MISVRSRTRALTSSSRLRCWRGLRSSLQITTSNSPSSFRSRSAATLPMPRKCAGSTSDRRCTSVPTTSVPAVRARSASSAIWSRTLSGVAPGSRIPTRYARSRGLLVVITLGISELELPHPRHRFLEPCVGSRDRKPEIAFAVRAETDTGCDVHADLIEHMGRKTNRVIPVGHRRPYIKGRAWRLDLPAEAVQGVGHNAMAARVDSARCPRLLLPTVHRLDRRPLYRLENARVDVRLQLADQVHEVRAAADPADPPAGHVVRLRQGVKFEADFLRAWDLEKRQRSITVERDLGIRRVVAEHDVARVDEGERHVADAVLGAERRQDLGLRVELDTGALAVPVRDRITQFAKPEVRRVAVIRRIGSHLLQHADDATRRRQVGIANAERDHIDPGALFRLHLAVDLREEIGRNPAKPFGTRHRLAHASSPCMGRWQLFPIYGEVPAKPGMGPAEGLAFLT